MSDYDYTEYEEKVEGDNALGAIRDLARQQKEAELLVSQLEDELTNAKENLRQIAEVKLPELMDELRIPSFQTSDGLKVTIKETIRASIGRSDEEKNKALNWLDENGHGHLIKRIVEIPFGRGKDQEANTLRTNLAKQGVESYFERKVESSTLRAFVTEMLESGETIPLDLFKVLRDRRSKVEV